MKKFIGLLLSLGVLAATILWSAQTSTASFSDATRQSYRLRAATLDLASPQDLSRPVELGAISPGDAGMVTIALRNSGTIPGTLTVSPGQYPPAFLTVSYSPQQSQVASGGTVSLELDWNFPAENHDQGLDGQQVTFSYRILFENGFRVSKEILITGTVLDPADTPTPTATSTETPTPTPTGTMPPEPTATEAAAPSPTATQTAAAVDAQDPAASETTNPEGSAITPSDTPVVPDSPGTPAVPTATADVVVVGADSVTATTAAPALDGQE